MADIKISQLGEALAVTDNDILPMTASGVTSKVKASTMKDYMIGNTNISGLGDGTPTGAIDALDDEIDANYAEWKTQWKNNGAYNLCPNTASTQSVGGVTITVNSNKTVTIGTGTTSSSIFFRTAANFTVDNTGTYKLVGSPTDIPASSKLYVFDESLGNTAIQDADGNGGTGTLTAGTLYGMAISIPASTVISQAITFKPMITTDLNATYADYVPYAMNNRQLTEEISKKNFATREILTSGTEYTAPSDGYVVAMAQTANNTYYIEVNSIRVEAGWASSTSWGSGSIRVTKGMKCKPVGDACFFIPIV